MMALPKPNKDGTCTNCDISDFVLAKDMTHYSPCRFDEDRNFVPSYGHPRPSDHDNAVRFFCANCGTPHQVPEGL